MVYNPYKSLNSDAFWKNGVEHADITFPGKIYNPKWKINDTDKIATMGSCFAQHIAKWLRGNGYNVPFYETVGFNEVEPMFSANYGNVYTVRQALQLIQESIGERTPSEVAWVDGEKFIDAIRPNSIKGGFKTSDDVIAARREHLNSVGTMVDDFDILIFTLGLTETWKIKQCGTIIPTAPGVIAGTFDSDKYEFVNFRYEEIMDDLYNFCDLITEIRGGRPFKLLLTVSPVPLTATATNQHVLVATTYSKAVLRTVADDFVTDNDFAEYFPSFEMINNPAARSEFFESNLRSVKPSAVENVMNVFSSLALTAPVSTIIDDDAFDPDCEDALLEEFGDPAKNVSIKKSTNIVCVGDSHLAGFYPALTSRLENRGDVSSYSFPTNWLQTSWGSFDENKYLTEFTVKNEYKHLIDDVSLAECNNTLVLVGVGIGGDTIVRCHGRMLRDLTPPVPIKLVVDRPLIDFYKHRLATSRRLILARQLDENAVYDKIFWVAAPDMCVDVAKFRLGDKFVNSGSYVIHKTAYMTAFNECVGTFKKVQFIFHNDALCDPSTGFSLNSYPHKPGVLRDIHCNADYYSGIIDTIIN